RRPTRPRPLNAPRRPAHAGAPLGRRPRRGGGGAPPGGGVPPGRTLVRAEPAGGPPGEPHRPVAAPRPRPPAPRTPRPRRPGRPVDPPSPCHPRPRVRTPVRAQGLGRSLTR